MVLGYKGIYGKRTSKTHYGSNVLDGKI